MIDVVVTDSKNRIKIVNGWRVVLKMGPILRDTIARSAFPDPNMHKAFKGTEGWKKMGDF
jgi:hypothetical protein